MQHAVPHFDTTCVVGSSRGPPLGATQVTVRKLIRHRQTCQIVYTNSGKCRRERLVPAQASGPAIAAETTPSGRALPADFGIISRDRKWRVRLVNKDSAAEVRVVVRLQTDGFHIRNPIPFLDSAFYSIFKAEVLSEMQKKLRYNPGDRFVCLIVESIEDPGEIVGVVEVSYINEKEVLKSLEPGTERFVYVASMAVDPSVHRQGAASALLLAAENVGHAWDEQQVLLHVYQDNFPAIELYKKRGFEIIYQDAPWLAKLAVRPRFLMRRLLR